MNELSRDHLVERWAEAMHAGESLVEEEGAMDTKPMVTEVSQDWDL
jgi:hypothetical protein